MKRTIITFLSLSVFSIGSMYAQTLTFGNSKANAKSAPTTEFKAKAPIYGLLTLPQPLNTYTATSPNDEKKRLINNVNNYQGDIFKEIIFFKVTAEIIETPSKVIESATTNESSSSKNDKSAKDKLSGAGGKLRDLKNGNVSLPKKEEATSTTSSSTPKVEEKQLYYYSDIGFAILKKDAKSTELYFDIVAEKGKASTGYSEGDFSKSLTYQASLYAGKKVKFTITYDSDLNIEIGNKDMTFSQSFVVDYAEMKEDSDFYTWDSEFDEEYNNIFSNIQDEITANATEKVNFASSNSISGAAFKSEFKAGEPIYAVLDLGKKLKEYAVEPASNLAEQKSLSIPSINRILSVQMFYQIEGQEWERNPIIGEIGITDNMLDASKLILDIAPSVEGATNYFPFGSEMYRNVNDPAFAGKKVNIGYQINDKTNALIQSGIEGINIEGQITIDYTGFTAKMINDWNDKMMKATTAAKTSFINNENKFNYEKVKSMPLPICFTRESKGGYASVSKDKIISLIKQKYGVTEVLGLRFDGGGQGDFRELVDANTNYPTCKMGNTVFYFAFKEADGSYRFTGGVLIQDYIGYGKYGEMYIKDYAPGQDGDPDFPYDYARDAKGNYSIFIFDGAKLK